MRWLSTILLFFIQVSVDAETVHLYQRKPSGLKIYTAFTDLNQTYRNEMKGKEYLISDEFTLKNQRSIEAFRKLHFSSQGSSLSLNTLNQLQKKLINHPVAGWNPKRNYENTEGTIGYCFGRALLAQKELKRLGVDKGRLFKVFLIGELSRYDRLWNYHVATLYVGHQGEPMVVDSLHQRVLALAEWYQEMHRYFLNPIQPKVLLYFAEIDKFQTQSGQFTSAEMFNPLYNGFFLDLALWL